MSLRGLHLSARFATHLLMHSNSSHAISSTVARRAAGVTSFNSAYSPPTPSPPLRSLLPPPTSLSATHLHRVRRAGAYRETSPYILVSCQLLLCHRKHLLALMLRNGMYADCNSCAQKAKSFRRILYMIIVSYFPNKFESMSHKKF